MASFPAPRPMKNDPSEALKNAPFSMAIEVKGEDIDELGHVNNVVYLGWVQWVAAGHWNTRSSPEIRSKSIWVALRHEIDYFSPAFLGDEVKGYTWVSAVDGAKSIRNVVFYRGDKCLAKATTTWCMLDAASLKPRRIGQEIRTLLGA